MRAVSRWSAPLWFAGLGGLLWLIDPFFGKVGLCYGFLCGVGVLWMSQPVQPHEWETGDDSWSGDLYGSDDEQATFLYGFPTVGSHRERRP